MIRRAPDTTHHPFELGERPLAIPLVAAIARRRARLVLGSSARERMEQTRAHLEAHVAAGERIYGVTTGFGERVVNGVAAADAAANARNLVRFHGCGTGALLPPDVARAVVVARAASLAAGWSGVRPVVVERLCALLDADVIPCIPAEGSVGASGDLTPLSYVAAVLMGEREVFAADGTPVAAAPALAAAGIRPLVLAPKESLALMNGTSAMTGIACLAVSRAARSAQVAAALSAAAVDVLGGNAGHFDARISRAKPHPGQGRAAAEIAARLAYEPTQHVHPAHLQDAYALRCAPHVIGVVADALDALSPWVETELNGANDNPLIDPESGEWLVGGNFYGGHIAFAMDALKGAVANLADLADRQLDRLVNPMVNRGLPANLVAVEGAEAMLHHGFKAMQITASALTAEALKLTMPASVFSRSTESHNQDKVSMGTIAARDASRIADLTERVHAILLLALAQAADIREAEGASLTRATTALRDAVRERVAQNVADRRQDLDIVVAVELLADSDALGPWLKRRG